MENGEVKAKQIKKRSRRTAGASGFETLRAEAVRQLKERNPDLSEQISYWDNWLNCQKNKIISDKMSDSEKIGHISLLNYSFIRQLRYDFGIRSFSCPLRQNIAIEDSA